MREAKVQTLATKETPVSQEPLLPEDIIQEMTQMIDIETKVICNQLATCLEVSDHLAKVLFQRLSVNAMTIGNLSLVIASMKRQVAMEIDLTEQKLAES